MEKHCHDGTQKFIRALGIDGRVRGAADDRQLVRLGGREREGFV